jgi:trehalose synthase
MSENNGQRMPLDEFEPEHPVSIKQYQSYIGAERVDEIKRLAEPLEGIGWANVNSTFMGGGVAEMLRSVIPLARDLGLRASWYVIRGTDDFFKVTKKFHNMLQGLDNSISLEEIFGAYLDTIHENSKNTYIASDMVVVHDPQPAALVMNGVIFGNVLWRCHIDTSAPNMTIWRFLLPYVNHCAGAIFTMPEFVGPGLQIPIYQVAPCIDPLAEKNRMYTDRDALEILSPLFNEHDVDPERPIIAAISRYDIHKNQATILKSFQKLREEKSFDKPPYLIFLGNTATDDPEGEEMLDTLKNAAGDDPDVRFWVNVENNDQVVGALMKIARTFVHVSTREGFGLVVAEALWQGTPVIGSKVGGITQQVVDGKTGFLVDPFDAGTIAARMADLLERPDQAEVLGGQGREHVRRNFLLPELVRKYLVLLQFYTGVRRELPEFRLNGLSYSEVISVLRSRHPDLESTPRPMRAS